MGTRKTELDVRREDKAFSINSDLLDAGFPQVRVIAGGKKGPYTVAVHRLNEREMREVVRAACHEVDRLRARKDLCPKRERGGA